MLHCSAQLFFGLYRFMCLSLIIIIPPYHFLTPSYLHFSLSLQWLPWQCNRIAAADLPAVHLGQPYWHQGDCLELRQQEECQEFTR